MLDREILSMGLTSVTLKLAFMAGSSKQGNIFLASVGWNDVVAKYLSIREYQYINEQTEK